MKIAVIDDYPNVFRTLNCAGKLKNHEVVVYNDTEKDPDKLARRLDGAEAVLLTQQRSRVPRALVEKLLPLLAQIAPHKRVTGEIAEVRGLPAGTDAHSPSRFPDINSLQDLKRRMKEIRSITASHGTCGGGPNESASNSAFRIGSRRTGPSTGAAV